MTILFLHRLNSTPGGIKPTYLKDHGHTVLNPALPDEDFDEAVGIAQAEFERGKPAVGLFNRGEKKTEITADLKMLGFTGKCTIRDLWRQKDLGTFDAQFKTPVAPHGVVLVKVSKD